jgi:hypothetical protein
MYKKNSIHPRKITIHMILPTADTGGLIWRQNEFLYSRKPQWGLPDQWTLLLSQTIVCFQILLMRHLQFIPHVDDADFPHQKNYLSYYSCLGHDIKRLIMLTQWFKYQISWGNIPMCCTWHLAPGAIWRNLRNVNNVLSVVNMHNLEGSFGDFIAIWTH